MPHKAPALVLAALLLAVPAAAADAARAPEPGRACAARTLEVPILTYHRVNVVSPGTPAMTRRLTVSPAVFERQLRWLRRHGYETITQRRLYDALACRRRLPRKPVLVTLDDGYRDTFFRAMPILSRLRMRATAYVITGRTSRGDASFLTWPLVRELERHGVEIGSHTVTHRDLVRLPDRELVAELTASRRTLERRLGHPVRWLAYPFGAYDSRVDRLARRAGYLLAVTTAPGTRQSWAERLALRRLTVTNETGVHGLAALLRG